MNNQNVFGIYLCCRKKFGITIAELRSAAHKLTPFATLQNIFSIHLKFDKKHKYYEP